MTLTDGQKVAAFGVAVVVGIYFLSRAGRRGDSIELLPSVHDDHMVDLRSRRVRAIQKRIGPKSRRPRRRRRY